MKNVVHWRVTNTNGQKGIERDELETKFIRIYRKNKITKNKKNDKK